jgi:hypothetical protein
MRLLCTYIEVYLNLVLDIIIEMRLTPRQRIFIVEYLADKNATKAAIRAGYSPKTARSIGSENLTKPNIASAIEKGFAEQLLRANVSAERVLYEIKRIAFADGGFSRKLHALELLGKGLGIFREKPATEASEFSVLDLQAPSHNKT